MVAAGESTNSRTQVTARLPGGTPSGRDFVLAVHGVVEGSA